MNTEKPLIITGRSEIQGRSVETCDARDLHAFLGVRRRFADWIQDYIRQFGFIEGQDFVTFNPSDELDFTKLGNQVGRGGDRRSKEYALTLNMARELCMLSRTAKGKQARLYFIECEQRALGAAAVANRASSSLPPPVDEDNNQWIWTHGVTDGRKVILILNDRQIVPVDMDLDMIAVGGHVAILNAATSYRIIKPNHCLPCWGPELGTCFEFTPSREHGYFPCETGNSILLCPKNGHPLPLAFNVRGFIMGTNDEIGRTLDGLGWSVIQSIRIDPHCNEKGERA
ncbi:antA/AntB antirepressor family protein [Acidithiobacillus sp. MC6.1]|nr:antA/AntB antirepressor family protein [Acidithiobacillus sp. MC6.1]